MARLKRKKSHQAKKPQIVPLDSQSEPVLSSRLWQWLVILLLLLFGIYQVVIYYQHQPVPSSDFVAFSNTTRPLLHFELPSIMKRVPMLGLFHIAVGAICPGPHPELTAGWLLNGLFHALSLVLFYRVAKHLLGPPAFYFAILASVNPWLLQLSCDPIAETAIIFFTLLTFDFILRRSRWCYLIAMIASMIRYECAALIAISFFVDMVLCKTKKEKLYVLLYAFLASLPMGLWLLATKLTWKPGASHYVGHFTKHQRIGLKYWSLLWNTTFGPLVQVPSAVAATFGELKITSQAQADQIRHSMKVLSVAIRIVTGIGFVGAFVTAAIRKNWKFWALFAFWIAYVGIHSIRHATLDRYTVPVIWLTLLIAFYGLQCLGRWVANKMPPVRLIAISGYCVVVITCIIGIAKLAPILPASAPRSKDSTSLVYVSISVVLVYLVMQWWAVQKRDIFKSVACLSLCGLLLVSNQFQVVRMLGNGGKDGEFKMLAEWYVENAQPGEKLATTMPGTVRLFIPEYKDCIVFTGGGETFLDFIQFCYKHKITYVVWDSRLGLTPNDSYYKSWKLQKMAPLSQPKDVGPFQFVERIYRYDRRYLHVFKLRPLSSLPPAIQEQIKSEPPKPKQPQQP